MTNEDGSPWLRGCLKSLVMSLRATVPKPRAKRRGSNLTVDARFFEIAEPVPSKARNLAYVCFGFASQPLRSSQ